MTVGDDFRKRRRFLRPQLDQNPLGRDKRRGNSGAERDDSEKEKKGKRQEAGNARLYPSFAVGPLRGIVLETIPTKPGVIVREQAREHGVPPVRGRTMVEILSRIGDQPDEAVTPPRPPGEAEELRATDAGPVSIFVDVLDDSWQTTSLNRAEDSAAEKQHISAAVSGVKAGS